jgi:hypothetical protein
MHRLPPILEESVNFGETIISQLVIFVTASFIKSVSFSHSIPSTDPYQSLIVLKDVQIIVEVDKSYQNLPLVKRSRPRSPSPRSFCDVHEQEGIPRTIFFSSKYF